MDVGVFVCIYICMFNDTKPGKRLTHDHEIWYLYVLFS